MRVGVSAALLPVVAAVLLCASGAAAGGFAIAEQGARASGRAGAFVADAADPSALSYNPAGISQLAGLELYLGANLITPLVAFDAADTGATVDADLAPTLAPNAYAAYRLNPTWVLGIGVSTPFGTDLQWPADSAARFVIREQTLNTVFITPAAAADASTYIEGLSIGVGVDLVPARVFLSRALHLGADEGSLELSGDAFGAGGRVGLLFRPPSLSPLSFGVTWKSPIGLQFKGRGDFETEAGVPRSSLPPDGVVKTHITLPQSLVLGAAFRSSALTVELDLSWSDWSTYERLEIELPDGSSSLSDKSWHDSYTARAGVELSLGPLAVRGGYALDTSPVPDTRLDFAAPDGTRHVLAAGVGLSLWVLKVDAAATYILPLSRETSSQPLAPPEKGSFQSSALLLSVNVGLAFDTAPAPAEDEAGADESPEGPPEETPEAEQTREEERGIHFEVDQGG